MKNLKYMSLVMALVCMISLGFNSCSSSDDNEKKDMTYPEISGKDIVAVPTDCEVFKRGEVIPLNYIFTDDTELGSYNIEIHNNFDHHTHSTSSVECPMDEKKNPVNPWVYNQDFKIPAGQCNFTARHDISIPADIDPGDYHFMIRLTDRAGWQQLHAVAIKIIETSK
ncbi:MAG: DUF4625 domain-containing protein [Prevotella sp.]|nr:DUF4625 domain-containing protein [Prevotella sp.]